jgi:hypothetical protein
MSDANAWAGRYVPQMFGVLLQLTNTRRVPPIYG